MQLFLLLLQLILCVLIIQDRKGVVRGMKVDDVLFLVDVIKSKNKYNILRNFILIKKIE
jgi:hypothetical protein